MPAPITPPPETQLHEVLHHLLYVEQLDALHLHLSQLDELLQANVTPSADQILAITSFPPLQAELKQLLTEQPELAEPKRLLPILHELQHAAQKRRPVRLTVACHFEEADIREMMQELTNRIGAPVVLKLTVEPQLIAGVIVEHGNFSSDYSVRTRLQQLKHTWTKAVTSDDVR